MAHTIPRAGAPPAAAAAAAAADAPGYAPVVIVFTDARRATDESYVNGAFGSIVQLLQDTTISDGSPGGDSVYASVTHIELYDPSERVRYTVSTDIGVVVDPHSTHYRAQNGYRFWYAMLPAHQKVALLSEWAHYRGRPYNRAGVNLFMVSPTAGHLESFTCTELVVHCCRAAGLLNDYARTTPEGLHVYERMAVEYTPMEIMIMLRDVFALTHSAVELPADPHTISQQDMLEYSRLALSNMGVRSRSPRERRLVPALPAALPPPPAGRTGAPSVRPGVPPASRSVDGAAAGGRQPSYARQPQQPYVYDPPDGRRRRAIIKGGACGL